MWCHDYKTVQLVFNWSHGSYLTLTRLCIWPWALHAIWKYLLFREMFALSSWRRSPLLVMGGSEVRRSRDVLSWVQLIQSLEDRHLLYRAQLCQWCHLWYDMEEGWWSLYVFCYIFLHKDRTLMEGSQVSTMTYIYFISIPTWKSNTSTLYYSTAVKCEFLSLLLSFVHLLYLLSLGI